MAKMVAKIGPAGPPLVAKIDPPGPFKSAKNGPALAKTVRSSIIEIVVNSHKVSSSGREN